MHFFLNFENVKMDFSSQLNDLDTINRIITKADSNTSHLSNYVNRLLYFGSSFSSSALNFVASFFSNFFYSFSYSSVAYRFSYNFSAVVIINHWASTTYNHYRNDSFMVYVFNYHFNLPLSNYDEVNTLALYFWYDFFQFFNITSNHVYRVNAF